MKPSYLIKPALDESYPEIDYGKGVFLFDKEGKKYLDAASGAVTANIGHGVPEIILAMHEQSKRVSFVYRSQFTSEAAEKLAEKLADALPGNLNWSFFVNSGSEATETALKNCDSVLARERNKDKNKNFIKMDQLSRNYSWCSFNVRTSR